MQHAVVDTAIGQLTVAWTQSGLCEVRLPGERRRAPGDPGRPPPPVRRAIRLIQSWAHGSRVDFSRVPLDLGCSTFARKLYEAARRIPPGQTVTYGELARRIGKPKAARAVGTALGRNPVPVIVPCHRIVSSSGIGGFSATGGVRLKLRLLALEAGLPNGRSPRLARH